MVFPVLFVKKCVFSLTRTGEKAYNKKYKNSRWILSASVRSCRGFFSVAIPVDVVGKKKRGRFAVGMACPRDRSALPGGPRVGREGRIWRI